MPPIAVVAAGAIGSGLAWKIFAWGAWYFWAAAAIAALGHFFRDRANQAFESWTRDEQERQLEALHVQAAALPDVIRTHPGPDFVNQLGLAFEECHELVDAFERSEASLEDLLEVAQHVLVALAELARLYDGGTNEKHTYGANMMLFAPAGSCTSCEDWLVFKEPETDVAKLAGLLVLGDALKATADGDDESTPSFALPVPTADNVGHPPRSWRVLPGAPAAFARKEFEFFSDTRELTAWIRDHSELSDRIENEVATYFDGEQDTIGCVFAVPVFRPDSSRQRSTWDVLAILNFHWSNPRVLSFEPSVFAFGHLVYPFRVLLARLLQQADPDQLLNTLVSPPQRRVLAVEVQSGSPPA